MKMFEQHTLYTGRYDQSDVLVVRRVGGGTVHGVGGRRVGGGGNCLPGAGEGGGGHGGRDKPDSLFCLACLQLWFIHREEGIFLHLSNALSLSLSLAHSYSIRRNERKGGAESPSYVSQTHVLCKLHYDFLSIPSASSPPPPPAPHSPPLDWGGGATRIALLI